MTGGYFFQIPLQSVEKFFECLDRACVGTFTEDDGLPWASERLLKAVISKQFCFCFHEYDLNRRISLDSRALSYGSIRRVLIDFRNLHEVVLKSIRVCQMFRWQSSGQALANISVDFAKNWPS